MADEAVYLFISPHLDDVVISCGGYINHLTTLGNKVVIATVATADDNGRLPMSWLVQRGLRMWRLGDRPFTFRREEDKSAAKILGAEVVHFGLLDCAYRRDESNQFLYTKRVTDVPIHPSDWENFEPALQSKLIEFLQHYSTFNMRILCPLAIGGHVDHILVRHAVEAVSDSQTRIYYEDFPYALKMQANNNLKPLIPYNIALSPEDMQARLDASACYVSQIPGLFPSQLEVLHEIICTRIPIIRQFFPLQYNLEASIRRMGVFIRPYSMKIGGERYWANDNTVGLYGILPAEWK